MADSKFLASAAYLSVFVLAVLGQSTNTANTDTTETVTATTSAISATTSATTATTSAISDSDSSSDSSSTTTATSAARTTNTASSDTVTTVTSASSTRSVSNTLPTLSTSGVTSVIYPGASVPPTSEAPFMHRSSAREGTVFIAVGAILGTFALAVLLWRAIVACMLHRSVERAARAQALANDKAAYPIGSQAPFYKYTDQDSSASLAYGGHESAAAAGVTGPSASNRNRRSTRGGGSTTAPSMSNLFYSPTAAPSAGLNSNRNSSFLPAGFYASAAPSPPVGTNINIANLRPDSRGNSNGMYMRDSPDGSPHFGPSGRRDISSSTVNLTGGPRAPSAYLEDLLDENPNMFPPQGGRHSGRY